MLNEIEDKAGVVDVLEEDKEQESDEDNTWEKAHYDKALFA